jgi:hypothetical protein
MFKYKIQACPSGIANTGYTGYTGLQDAQDEYIS